MLVLEDSLEKQEKLLAVLQALSEAAMLFGNIHIHRMIILEFASHLDIHGWIFLKKVL
jgi:hypothetical protein